MSARSVLKRASFAVAPLLLASAVAAGAGPARAAAVSSPGQQIAAALHKSPLYVDPSLSSAFTPAGRTRLLQAIRKAPVPVYVLAVPLVSGGQWSSGQQLAAVVQQYVGRPGVYLTTDETFGGDIDAYTAPSSPDGNDAPHYAEEAAQAENLAVDSSTTTLADKFQGAIQLITSGQALSVYKAAVKRLDAETPGLTPARPGGSGGGLSAALIAVIAVAALAVVSAGGLLLVRRRRRRRPAGSLRPRSVFASARTANEGELREQAQQQVIALGELVEQSDGPLTDAAQALTARALDAYEAAGKVLDQADGLCDLAGVLVLTHLGFTAARAAQVVQSGQPEPVAEPLCFFNPLHGEAARRVRWRPLGSRQTLGVHACAECVKTTAQHRLPEVLTDRTGGQSVPYYEVSGEQSVWAATGYGQFGHDLVQRILTEGVRPRKRS